MSTSPPKRSGRGRPSMIEDPNFAKMVAELFAAGLGRQAMLDEMAEQGYDIKDKDTITRWRRDARIKVLVSKIIEDRTIQISRKIDAIIEGRLSQAESLDIRDLIAIRKEYGGSSLIRKEIADDSVTASAIKTMEDNPDLALELDALLRGQGTPLESGTKGDTEDVHIA